MTVAEFVRWLWRAQIVNDRGMWLLGAVWLSGFLFATCFWLLWLRR